MNMDISLKKNRYLHMFNSLNKNTIKYQAPLILKMYGALNKMSLYMENRYILCNFIDQYADILEIEEDIYLTNDEKTLNQLFLMAFNRAKQKDLLPHLFEEYSNCIGAISSKKEFR